MLQKLIILSLHFRVIVHNFMIRWAIAFQINDFLVISFSPVCYGVLTHPTLSATVRYVCPPIVALDDDEFHVTLLHVAVMQTVIIPIAAFYVSRTLFLVIIDGVSLFLLLL
jgi:hypothetical protein